MKRLLNFLNKFYGNYYYFFFSIGFILCGVLDIIMPFEMSLSDRILLFIVFGDFTFVMVPTFINEYLLGEVNELADE